MSNLLTDITGKGISIQGCPLHRPILESAGLNLIDGPGCFSKEKIIKDLNYGLFADAIKWDTIRVILEKETGISLLPVCEAFFNARLRRQAMADRNYGKLYATGNGKKTAGWIDAARFPEIARYVHNLHLGQLNGKRLQIVARGEKYISEGIKDIFLPEYSAEKRVQALSVLNSVV